MSSFKSLTMAATLAAFFVAGCQTTASVDPAPQACVSPEDVFAEFAARGATERNRRVLNQNEAAKFMALFNAAEPPTDYTADEVHLYFGRGASFIVMFEGGCRVRTHPAPTAFVGSVLQRMSYLEDA